MYRVKFEDGTYAYKFTDDELQLMRNGSFVMFTDDPFRVLVGPVNGEWKLDDDHRALSIARSLNPEDRLILSGLGAEDPRQYDEEG